MNKHFTHLHLHTEFSLLDGAIHLKDLIRYSQEQQWKAVGISDHGNVFGAVKFFQMAKKAGIKPILGIEMYLTPDANIKNAQEKYFHIIVIVQNRKGYENLCQLLAFAYQDGFYFKPRIDYATLEKFSEGLIISTACLGGHIPKLFMGGNTEQAIDRINWFKERFGPDRFFLEVMPPDQQEQIELNRLLFEHAKKLDVKVIATADAHYLRPEYHEAHEVLLSIQTKHQLSDPKRMTFGDCRAFLKTTDEMLDIFKENPEAVWNTGAIADSCEFEFEFGKLFFPQYPVPQQHTQESYFQKLCSDGLENLKEKNLIPSDQYQVYDDRLKLEMELIIKMGYVGYFLVVGDFIMWAKNQGISVGPGRGSAAGSLVAWALLITNVDPIKYNLLFERFLNPERVSMPDIDIDFCVERREEVINYVKDKYGHDCVCQIITFGTMMAKGVIKDVARVLGFPFQDANNLTNMIPDQLKITLKEAMEQEPRLQEMVDNNPQVKNLMDLCLKLEGLTRHASKHAAGVVISPEPLRKVLPLYIPAKTDELVTQYAMTELESIGFLKMDFLGLTNLTVIDRTLEAIKKNHGVTIDLDTLALDDAKTLQLLADGKTNGVFQFESDGIKDVLRKLCPDKFEDLIAVNALYRPGPLGSGMVDDFIERRHGRKKTTYMFAELEPILAETYGVIVYQEQVMKIASAIAGYSLGAADILRRAMGKKKVEVMAEQKELFVKGATERGFDTKKAGELFDLMAYFAGYGFNKSHSTAYALIAYHTAYLKAHYPHEFMAALVSYVTNDPDKMSYYLQEISDMNLETLSPDINASFSDFTALNGTVLFGLKGIKNVGLAALQDIIAQREKKPFIDLLDFCTRIDLRTANKRVIESLICAGAFDKLPGNRAQQMQELDKIIALANEAKEAAKTGQTNLFALAKPQAENAPDEVYVFAPLEDWPDKIKLEKEKAAAGFYLSSHPLASYKDQTKWFTFTPFTDVLAYVKGEKKFAQDEFVTCALLQSNRQITTKKGDKMAFGQCEDQSGSAELVIFPRQYTKVEEWLNEYNVFIIQGTPDFGSENKCKIKVSQMVPIELFFENWKVQGVTLELPTGFEKSLLDELKSSYSKGAAPVSLAFRENGEMLAARNVLKMTPSKQVLQTLESKELSVTINL